MKFLATLDEGDRALLKPKTKLFCERGNHVIQLFQIG